MVFLAIVRFWQVVADITEAQKSGLIHLKAGYFTGGKLNHQRGRSVKNAKFILKGLCVMVDKRFAF